MGRPGNGLGMAPHATLVDAGRRSCAGTVGGGRGSQVHRTVRVIDRLLRVAQDEGCAGLLARIVSGVRLREGKPELQRLVPLRDAAWIIQRVTRVSAVADHVKAAIPLGGQAHLERDLRQENAGDSAMGRGRGASRHHRRRDLCDFLRFELAQRLTRFVRLNVCFRVVHERGFELGESLGAEGNRRRGDDR